ncbi:hypothetical protein V8G54_020736 [Vigna mungo]|uniref:Uncharacterized protein n=1 Tax=Vigna mungo TaxID=3915 RepID=A0AAQ3NEA5_VIGMU
MKKIKVKGFSTSRRLNQEEKSHVSKLKSDDGITTKTAKSLENEEIDAMAKRKKDQGTASSSTDYERDEDIELEQGLEEEEEGRREFNKLSEQQTDLNMMDKFAQWMPKCMTMLNERSLPKLFWDDVESIHVAFDENFDHMTSTLQPRECIDASESDASEELDVEETQEAQAL